MRITTKGQVTIPQHIREKYGLAPASEIEFVEEKGRVYIVKIDSAPDRAGRFRKLRGVGNLRMTTDEILALTRKDE